MSPATPKPQEIFTAPVVVEVEAVVSVKVVTPVTVPPESFKKLLSE